MELDNNIEIKKISKKMSQFVVIGLGRFGRAVATTLMELGNEVLAVDKDKDAINQIEGIVSGAAVADVTAEGVLSTLGVQNFDCVISCIGGSLETSVLITHRCKQLGVEFVVVRANNPQNKEIYERIGADIVFFPEFNMGKKLANVLSNPSMNEVLSLADDFKIVETTLPDNWADKTVLELEVRKKYKVSVIYIKRDDTVVSVDADTKFQKGDILILAGENKYLASVNNMTSDVIDTNHSLHGSV